MNHIVGTAVRVECEINEDEVAATTVSLESLLDPSGNTILSNQAMAYDTVNANIAFMVWQSTSAAALGRYKYLIKALNGTRETFARGAFNLEAV